MAPQTAWTMARAGLLKQCDRPDPMPRFSRFALALVPLAIAACASTTTARLIPSPQAPVCQGQVTAQILWTTHWRADQKDVAAREAAAADGLDKFFGQPRCFGAVSVRRLPENSTVTVQDAVARARTRQETVVLITVRELGPTVRIGSSLALVEGGTEVVLDLAEYLPSQPMPRTFTVQWRSGGPGVLKGVATLPQDMQAALAAGLQLSPGPIPGRD